MDQHGQIMSISRQLECLCPELQVAIHELEEEYNSEVAKGKERRKFIIENQYDLYEANLVCGKIIKTAMNKRYKMIKELREIWGDFFYHNPQCLTTFSSNS